MLTILYFIMHEHNQQFGTEGVAGGVSRRTSLAPVLWLVCGACFVWLAAGCGHVDKDAGNLVKESGRTQFESYCAACHQSGGVGIEGRVPPLTDSPWVAGREDRLIRIVLHGLRGPIEIQGQTYNMEMPNFQLLTDEEMASVLSYVRARYGTPSPPITAATVRRVRGVTQGHTGYWTVEELLDVP